MSVIACLVKTRTRKRKKDIRIQEAKLYQRQHIQSTKKKGCPAKIVMKEVLGFPEYKAKQDTENARRKASEKLRQDLEVMGSNMKREHRIYISLPKDEEHQNMHFLGQITGFMNTVNKEVREKLYEMVGHGVTSVSEMRSHL
nr:uncharacterized protein LOC117690837 [Crassostrea gigas]